MSSLNLDFYINKHRKAYEERLKKEQSNQENSKDSENKENQINEPTKQASDVTILNKIKDKTIPEPKTENFSNSDEKHLDQVDTDYLYALKLNEALNGVSDKSIKSKYDKIINDVNKLNNEETNKDDEIRVPDDFYVECLLDDNDTHPYYMDYNYNNFISNLNSNSNLNLFNNTTVVRQYNTRNSRNRRNVRTVRNGIDVNGIDVNGVDVNGIDVNGIDVNGIDVNGIDVNGIDVNGIDVNGIDVNDDDFNCCTNNLINFRNDNVDYNIISSNSDEDNMNVENKKKNSFKNEDSKYINENVNDVDFIYITDDNAPLSSTPKHNNFKHNVKNTRDENKTNNDVIYICENECNGDRDKIYPINNRKRKDNEGDDEYSYKNLNENENNRKKKSQKKNIYEINNEYFNIRQNDCNGEEKNYSNDNLIHQNFTIIDNVENAENAENAENSFEYISNVYNLSEDKYENISEKKPKKSSKREIPDAVNAYHSSSIYSFKTNKNEQIYTHPNGGNYLLNETQNILSEEYNDNVENVENVENAENAKNNYEKSLSKHINTVKNINCLNKYKDEYDFHKIANINLRGHYLTEKDFTFDMNENCLDNSTYNGDENKAVYEKNNAVYEENDAVYEENDAVYDDNNTSNIKDSLKNRNYKNNSESCETHFVKDINFDYSFSSNKNDDVLIFNNNTNDHNNNLNNSHTEDIYKYYIS
ncbi:conserved Plasmodium protein, unknown function [Plasmodium yoelii]|uniref:Uncharacterized protein n=1 Tax=Plasmodium yoelii TaxID=5861 RepID=A0A077Y407_PLAYE|nr:conserved Plasmodium protein, unknown function [Plasmodium yoelii]